MLGTFGAIGVATLLLGGQLAGESLLAEQRSMSQGFLIERFNQRVRAYVALHLHIERFLPQRIFTDPDEARQMMVSMANAMRAVRPKAAEGDIFDSEIAALFRDEIWRWLRDGGIDPAMLAVEMVPEVPGEYPAPQVNGPFSWALASAMPPCVLRVLPDLPIELQYRFVGADLVLIDLHANLVVDILRDALPGEDPRATGSRTQ